MTIAALLLLFLAAALRVPVYVLYLIGFSNGPSSIVSPVVPFLLPRLADGFQLTVVLLLAWLWSGVAAWLLGAQVTDATWKTARWGSVVLVAMVGIYMIVCGVLGALGLTNADVPSPDLFDYSLFAASIVQLLLSGALLGLCLYVYHATREEAVDEDHALRSSFRVVLIAEMFVFVGSVLWFVETSIRRFSASCWFPENAPFVFQAANAAFPGSAATMNIPARECPGSYYWIGLLADLFLYIGMIVMFLSYLLRARAKKQGPKLLSHHQEFMHQNDLDEDRYAY